MHEHRPLDAGTATGAAPVNQLVERLTVHQARREPSHQLLDLGTVKTTLRIDGRTIKHTDGHAAQLLVIVVVEVGLEPSSAEPGDGKTTILANLGVAFANSGKKTLLIDADLRRPGLTRMFEMKGTIGLSYLLRSDQDLVKAAAANIQPSGIDGLDVLPSGARPADPAELIASDRFADLLGWAESAYDQILIDSPPTLATVEASLIGRLVDGVILVVQPEKNQRRLVIRAADGFATLGTKLLGVVVNHIEAEKGLDYYGYGGGYGYGYGYGYGESEVEDTVEEDSMSEADRTGRVVPRRAA
ncbi:MAG: CpsD/CapB family tyrosine-protein kinase [Planctomycetes bacterium]|nr:CpsD/CapB family tyrosine-protein kinase [Planctomycetota bacterium]